MKKLKRIMALILAFSCLLSATGFAAAAEEVVSAEQETVVSEAPESNDADSDAVIADSADPEQEEADQNDGAETPVAEEPVEEPAPVEEPVVTAEPAKAELTEVEEIFADMSPAQIISVSAVNTEASGLYVGLELTSHPRDDASANKDKLFIDSEFDVQLLATAPNGIGALQGTIELEDGLEVLNVKPADEVKGFFDTVYLESNKLTFATYSSRTFTCEEATPVLTITLKVRGAAALNKDATVGLKNVTVARVGTASGGQQSQTYKTVNVVEGKEYIYCKCVLESGWSNWADMSGYTQLPLGKDDGWHYNKVPEVNDQGQDTGELIDACCTTQDSKIRTCDVCGLQYTGTAGHTYDETTLIAKTAGVAYYKCNREDCGALFSVTDAGVQQTIGIGGPLTGDLTGEEIGSANNLVGFVPQPDDPAAQNMLYIYDMEGMAVRFVGDGVITKNFVDWFNINVLDSSDKEKVVLQMTFSGGEKGMSIAPSAFEDLGEFYKKQIDLITIGFNVTSIGARAFYEFNALRTLVIDGAGTAAGSLIGDENGGEDTPVQTNECTLESIGEYAFYGAQLTGKLTIPKSVKTIGSYAFGGYTGTMLQPNQQTAIPWNYYNALTELTFDGATDVKANAFENSTSLRTLNLGDETVLRTDSFYNCTALTAITTGTAATIENGAFRCVTIDGEGENVTATTTSAPALQRVTLGLNPILGGGNANGLIGAFDSCPSLEEVYFLGGDTLTITADTFNNCANVDTVVIVGDHVTIKAGAFTGVGTNAGNGHKDMKVIIGAMRDEFDEYILDENGNYVLESGESCQFTIEANAFKDSGLASLAVGDNVIIESEAFNNCAKMTSVTLGDNVVIKSDAFKGTGNAAAAKTKGLTVTLGNNAIIEERAFKGSNGITAITAGNKASIGAEACSSSTTLESVTLGNEATIGGKAFTGCTALKTVIIGNDASIADGDATGGTFSGCTSVEEVVIGSHATIGSNAFKNSRRLKKLVVGGGESVISEGAFEGSGTAYTKPEDKVVVDIGVEFDEDGQPVTAENGAYVMQDGAPYERTNKIKEPYNATPFVTVKTHAFYSSGVSDLTLGNLIKVEPYAFEGCARLASIIIGNDAYLCDAAFARTGLNAPDPGTRLIIGDRAVIGDGSTKDDEANVVDKVVVTQEVTEIVTKGMRATKNGDTSGDVYLFEMEPTYGTYCTGVVYNVTMGTKEVYGLSDIDISGNKRIITVTTANGDVTYSTLTGDVENNVVVTMKETRTIKGDVYIKLNLDGTETDPKQLYIEEINEKTGKPTGTLIRMERGAGKDIVGATKLDNGNYTKGGIIYAPYLSDEVAQGSTSATTTETEKKEVEVNVYDINDKKYVDELDKWGNKTGNLVNKEDPTDILVPIYDDEGNITGYKPKGALGDTGRVDPPAPETTTVPKKEEVVITKKETVSGPLYEDKDGNRYVQELEKAEGETTGTPTGNFYSTVDGVADVLGAAKKGETWVKGSIVLSPVKKPVNEQGTVTPEGEENPVTGDVVKDKDGKEYIKDTESNPERLISKEEPYTVYEKDPDTGDYVNPANEEDVVKKDDLEDKHEQEKGNTTVEVPKTKPVTGVEVIDPTTGEKVIIVIGEDGEPTGEVIDPETGKVIPGKTGGKDDDGNYTISTKVDIGEEEPGDHTVPDPEDPDGTKTIHGVEVPDPSDPSGEKKVIIETDPETGEPTGKVIDPATGEEVVPPKTAGKDDDGNYVIEGPVNPAPTGHTVPDPEDPDGTKTVTGIVVTDPDTGDDVIIETDPSGNPTGNVIDPDTGEVIPGKTGGKNENGEYTIGGKPADPVEPEPTDHDVPAIKTIKGIEVPDPNNPGKTVIIVTDDSGKPTGKVIDPETGKDTGYTVFENEDGEYVIGEPAKPVVPDPSKHETEGGKTVTGVEVIDPATGEKVIIETNPKTGEPTGNVIDPTTGEVIPGKTGGKDDDGNYTISTKVDIGDDDPGAHNTPKGPVTGFEVPDPDDPSKTVIIETDPSGEPTGKVIDPATGEEVVPPKTAGKTESGEYIIEEPVNPAPTDHTVPDPENPDGTKTVTGIEVPDPSDPTGERKVIIETDPSGEPTGKVIDPATGEEVVPPKTAGKNENGEYVIGGKDDKVDPADNPPTDHNVPETEKKDITGGNIYEVGDKEYVEDPETGDLINTQPPYDVITKEKDPETGKDIYKDKDGNDVTDDVKPKDKTQPATGETEADVPQTKPVTGVVVTDPDTGDDVIIETDEEGNPTGKVIDPETGKEVVPAKTAGKDDDGNYVIGSKTEPPANPNPTEHENPSGGDPIKGVEVTDPDDPTGEKKVIIETDDEGNPTGRVIDPATGEEVDPPKSAGKTENGDYVIGDKVEPDNPNPSDHDVPKTVSGEVWKDPTTGKEYIKTEDGTLVEKDPPHTVYEPVIGDDGKPTGEYVNPDDSDDKLDENDLEQEKEQEKGDLTYTDPDTGEEKNITGGDIYKVGDDEEEYIEDPDNPGTLINTKEPHDKLTEEPKGSGNYKNENGEEVTPVTPKDKTEPVKEKVDVNVPVTEPKEGDVYEDDEGNRYIKVDDNTYVTETTPPTIYKQDPDNPGFYVNEDDPEDIIYPARDLHKTDEKGTAEVPKTTTTTVTGDVVTDDKGTEYIRDKDGETLISKTEPPKVYKKDAETGDYVNVNDSTDIVKAEDLKEKRDPVSGDITVTEPITETKKYKGDVYEHTVTGDRYILDKATGDLVLTHVNDGGTLKDANPIKNYKPEAVSGGIRYTNPKDLSDYVNESDLKNVTESNTTGAFEGSNVGDVDIGDHANIGDEAFKDTDNLDDVNIGKNTEDVGDGAFKGTGAGSIGFGDNDDGTTTNFGEGAISGNDNLTDLDLPDGTGELGKGSLADNENLKDLTIPGSTTGIGEGALDGNDNLENLTGGDNLGDLLGEGGLKGTGSGGLNLIIGANAENVTREDVIAFLAAVSDEKASVNGLTGTEGFAEFQKLYPQNEDGTPIVDGNGYPQLNESNKPILTDTQSQMVAQWKSDEAAKKILDDIIKGNSGEDYVDKEEIPGYNDMSEEEKKKAEEEAKKNLEDELKEKVEKNSNTIRCGDFDCNGAVEGLDAVLVAQYAIRAITNSDLSNAGISPQVAAKSGDVNSDSEINIMDAMVIAQYCVGIVTSLPIGKGNV